MDRIRKRFPASFEELRKYGIIRVSEEERVKERKNDIWYMYGRQMPLC